MACLALSLSPARKVFQKGRPRDSKEKSRYILKVVVSGILPFPCNLSRQITVQLVV